MRMQFRAIHLRDDEVVSAKALSHLLGLNVQVPGVADCIGVVLGAEVHDDWVVLEFDLPDDAMFSTPEKVRVTVRAAGRWYLLHVAVGQAPHVNDRAMLARTVRPRE